MAADKKKVKASLKVGAYKEIQPKVRVWIKSQRDLDKFFKKPIEYSKTIEVDPRKWDVGKLSKALFSLVRYELKLLDARATDAMKLFNQGGEKNEKQAIKNLTAEFNSLVKEMKNKCSLALDEVEADNGDNKKGLRDGKAALQKMAGMKADKIFSVPRRLIITSLETLATGLDQSNGEKNQEETVLKRASKDLSAARKLFETDGKDAKSASKFLLTTSSTITKNKNANAKLHDFAGKIKSKEKLLNDFVTKIGNFQIGLDDCLSDISQKKMTSDGARKLINEFERSKIADKTGSAVQKTMVDLKKAFGAIEKELK